MNTLVRAGVLTGYLEVAQQIGFNPRAVLQKFGLTRALLTNQDQRIPLINAVGLLEASAQQSGVMTFGLRMAGLRQLADMGGVSLLLAHQRNLRDVLQTTIEYRHLLNPSLAMFVESAGATAIIREEIVTDVPVPTHQATELAIGVMFRLCGSLAGPQWHPRSVNFTHDAPADLQFHRRFFRCPVVFDSEFNGIVCGASDLDLANPMADPAMARYAQRFLETIPGASEPSILLEVRKAIYLLLPMERATIEQIAQSLGMNVRTLQRRLEDAGENFSALVNGVRRDLVVRYMENPRYSVGRVAVLLGYGAPSSFTRWFISQFGVAPVVWRMKNGVPTTDNRLMLPH